MAVLTVRDNEGNEIPIPAIRGKSAYEYAKDGGYTGTEEEFAQELGGINKNFDYSIEEVPIGTWVDGRTIYRKVYTGTIVNTTYVSIESKTEIKVIVKSYGQLKIVSNGSICQLGCYLNSNVYCGIYLARGDINELQIYNSQALANSEYIVVVEYLKD